MSTIVEVLSGVLRFFPNTLIATLFVVGIATGKMSWVLTSIGGVLTAIAVLIVQYIFNKTLNLGTMPGMHVIEACSILPVASGTYTTMPSLWTALSTFFVSFVFVNAMNIYNTTPAHKSKEATAVQQRKGVGLISMLSIALLYLFLVVPRYRTGCESLTGMALGGAIGAAAGYLWWRILDACGADVYPDIHGVMLGLKPGFLRTHPMACTPQN